MKSGVFFNVLDLIINPHKNLIFNPKRFKKLWIKQINYLKKVIVNDTIKTDVDSKNPTKN